MNTSNGPVTNGILGTHTNTCYLCGGLIGQPGVTYGWGGSWCYCSQRAQEPKTVMQEMLQHGQQGLRTQQHQQNIQAPEALRAQANRTGWICPQCHKSNAPFVSSCDCRVKSEG